MDCAFKGVERYRLSGLGDPRDDGNAARSFTSTAVSLRFPFVGLIFGGRTATMAARSHIADDRLRSFIDVDVLDADMLVAAVPEATEGLHLP